MGGSFSSSRQATSNEMISEIYNECPTLRTMNIVNFDRSKFTLGDNCPPGSGSFDLSQTAVIDSQCILNNLQNTAANIANDLDAETKAGLGISIDDNTQTIRSKIEQLVVNQCAAEGKTSNNIAQIQDSEIIACDFKVFQNATINDVCKINNTQKQIADFVSKSKTRTSGGSLLGDLFGEYGGIILIVIAVIAALVLGGIAIAYFRSRGGGGSSAPTIIQTSAPTPVASKGTIDITQSGGFVSMLLGGADSSVPWYQNTSVLIIIIIALMLLALVIYGRNQNKRITITTVQTDKKKNPNYYQ